MSDMIRLSDAEWKRFYCFIPKAKPRADGKGRPRRDAREVMEGILWILYSGSPWHMLPKAYPPYQTCHRYFQAWTRQEVFKRLLSRLANQKHKDSNSKKPHFVDASFAPAKKGVQP